MARFKVLNPDEATGKTKDLFELVKGKMGMVPNVMRIMGNSPAVLNGYLSFNTALHSASIDNKLGELIALAVANENGCDYCDAAHVYFSTKMGLDDTTIDNARLGTSTDPKIKTALQFVKEILDKRGHVSDASIAAIKAAGFNDAEIIEIVAKTSFYIFTNYINIVAETVIDWPVQEVIQNHHQ
ncbi:peroxidase [Niastella yeongjuensis]|uniref:Peroxidase n=1 Tax=Niastella yeongjuensis TaxID=354355 RepID=A0A1V9F3M9_9BACT|nr:carboxymuconolactone decarboxylase family protein [Niastella yeongjuensis]OQP52866.1 peroxidase [Niastella yeongjuensis]SEP21371.1 uncharacterized peroxidase-related enzyme [Niastella yeongjuensis]